jgi:hypothetical protein
MFGINVIIIIIHLSQFLTLSKNIEHKENVNSFHVS